MTVGNSFVCLLFGLFKAASVLGVESVVGKGNNVYAVIDVPLRVGVSTYVF